jgi:hypothetical protein
MSFKPEKYLVNAPKRQEIAVGFVCALISLATASLLVWLIYLVAWRNPKVYGVHDLYKATTLAIFLVLFLISLGFSVLAFRLLSPNQTRRWLFSPLLLRLWGAFFATVGIFILAVGLITQDWKVVMESLHIIPFTIGMATATFLLARKRRRDESLTER